MSRIGKSYCSRLTLDGGGRAFIVGDPADALTVDGAERVVIRGFKFRDSLHGLVIRGSASASLAELNDSTIGSIECDSTVFLRGDTGVVCPIP